MRFEILLCIPIIALVGCAEPTYEECVRDAVEDGRSEYGIQVLTDLCDRAEQEKLRESASGSATAADAAAPADDAAVDPFAPATDAAAGADDDAASRERVDRMFYDATGLKLDRK
jgi:hypothetical protein